MKQRVMGRQEVLWTVRGGQGHVQPWDVGSFRAWLVLELDFEGRRFPSGRGKGEGTPGRKAGMSSGLEVGGTQHGEGTARGPLSEQVGTCQALVGKLVLLEAPEAGLKPLKSPPTEGSLARWAPCPPHTPHPCHRKLETFWNCWRLETGSPT